MWKKIGKVLLLGVAILALTGLGGVAYVRGYDLDAPAVDTDSQHTDLAFLRARPATVRRKVLAVVSSTARMGEGGSKAAGYELTELSRAYYVFLANGYDVDIASPRGGTPPMKLDDGLLEADYAFLNDAVARAKLDASLPLAQVRAEQYDAVYFVGGKGTMFDFPDNADVRRIVRDLHRRGGVIGAVCHGPAALVHITLDDGKPLLAGRRVTGFSNAEELFLIKDARQIFPFLLQDRMTAQGAQFVEGPLYLDNVVVDERLITGQNPWSTWSVAEAMVRALGHEPVTRAPTPEELAMRVLLSYHHDGPDAARQLAVQLPSADKRLVLMHALVAAMEWRLGDAWRLQSLAR